LLFSLIFCIQKDSCGYAKEKSIEKIDKCPSEKRKEEKKEKK
jgi:hypothetical protein